MRSDEIDGKRPVRRGHGGRAVFCHATGENPRPLNDKQRSMSTVTTTIKPIDHALAGVLGNIASMLIETERVHHIEGWRHTSALYWVSTRLNVRRVTLGALGKHPVDELADLAATVAEPRGARLASKALAPPLALFVVFEAWGPRNAVHTLDTVDRSRPTRPASLRPGVPVRVGMAVVGGHRLGVLRPRDDAPRFVHVRRPASPPPPRDESAEVPVFDVLADLYTTARESLLAVSA